VGGERGRSVSWNGRKSRASLARKSKLGLEGSVFISCLLLLCMGVSISLGVWMLMQKWSQMTYHQLRINRCVGQVALDFRDRLIEIEDLNSKMSVLRGSIRVARVLPALAPLLPGLELTLLGLVARQEVLLIQWRLRQMKWRVPGFCGNQRDRLFRLPALEFSRGVPDDVGPQLLRWDGDMPNEFLFQVQYQNRASAAQVKRKSEAKTQEWRAHWHIPVLYPGTDPI